MRVVETMGNRAEELRKQIVAGGGATATYSMNQRTTAYIIQRQEKGFDRKAEKAKLRRMKEEEFLQNLPKFQFDRALSHIIDGIATEEDFNYVARNIGNYEQVIGRFKINGVNGNGEKRVRRSATVTIVDFTRNPQSPCINSGKSL